MASMVYGPVPSWRLGRSLGVDIINTSGKMCSFDCTYCQLGGSVSPVVRRRNFVDLAELSEELESLGRVEADYATFSGMGEPTLAANLGEAIGLVKSALKLPVAVLTNSSLISRDDVREDLLLADLVVAKIDAPDEILFRQVNRPRVRTTLRQIIDSIRLFRSTFQGKLALQMMFIDANKSAAAGMAELAREIMPDEIQVNTPLRPCAVEALPEEELARIKGEFAGLSGVVSVYDSPRHAVTPLDAKETERRRPRTKQ
ncbi:MAG TPA: radical SAM protein [Dehalococcoidia bacterium]|nr:radical SAM protein [Dehalococcoidia bacterium]